MYITVLFRNGKDFGRPEKKKRKGDVVTHIVFVFAVATPAHNVMQDTGSVKSSWSWHARYLTRIFFGIDVFFISGPQYTEGPVLSMSKDPFSRARPIPFELARLA